MTAAWTLINAKKKRNRNEQGRQTRINRVAGRFSADADVVSHLGVVIIGGGHRQ
jgi:hypothetical protein